MADEMEISWQSYKDVQYDLQETSDFITWGTIATKQGDGTLQSHLVQVLPGQKRFYKLLQKFSGKEPLYLRAITSWDGSGVTLEWNAIEVSNDPNARYHLIKNGGTPGIPIAPLSVTTYRDTSVSSGQKYTYTLPIYAS